MAKNLNLKSCAKNSNTAFTSGDETAIVTLTRFEVEDLIRHMDELQGEDAIYHTYLSSTHPNSKIDRELMLDAVLNFYSNVRNLTDIIKAILSQGQS